MNNKSTNSHHNRIIGLDVVRFFAITIVVIYHSVILLAPLTSLPVIGQAIHYLIAFTEPLGILGVEFFFALSGFLIGSILIRTYMEREHFGFSEVRSFLVRRWFRTLPNYWLILILNFAVFTALGIRTFSAHHLKYFLFLQNLDSRHPRFFPEAWSLAVEEWFYLTAPLALMLISYLLRKHPRKRRLAVMLIMYPVLSILLRAIVCDNDNPDPLYFDHSVRKVVMLRLSSINYGVIIAYFRYFHPEKIDNIKKPLLITGLSGIVVLTAVHYIGIHPRFALYATSHAYRFFHNVFLIALVPFCASLVLPFAHSVRSLRSHRAAQVIIFISKISYSMYLVHFTLLLQATTPFLKLTPANCIPVYMLYWVAVIGLSAIIYKYYEMPIMRLRNKFSTADPSV